MRATVSEIRPAIDLERIARECRALNIEIADGERLVERTSESLKDRRMRLGKKLIEARNGFGARGDGFVEWVEKTIGIAYRTASDYMTAVGYVGSGAGRTPSINQCETRIDADEPIARGEDQILAEAKRIRAERETVNRDERLANLKLISESSSPLKCERKYPVILADPPWHYDRDISPDRALSNQYPTMSCEDIKHLPVEQQATDDAILFLWATSPLLLEVIEVMASWGFKYKTCGVWVKDRPGMGYWLRQQHELLLIGTRGEMPSPSPAHRSPSVFLAPRGEHSVKPTIVHEAIEAMYPTLPRIELFARNVRNGWDAWGNEVTND